MGPVDRFIARLTGPQYILLDGAFGTELAARGFDRSLPLYTAQALMRQPDLVRQIHREYLRAGADVIRANSFCTAPIALQSAGLERYRDDATDSAVRLATEAVEAEGAAERVIIVGCMSPLGSYLRDKQDDEALHQAHEAKASRLALAGIELVLCETMPSVREAVIAVQAVNAAGMRPIVSFVPSNARHLLSGETIDTAARKITPLRPLMICLNCCAPEIVDDALPTLLACTNLPIGVYASADSAVPVGNQTVQPSIMNYHRHAERWLELGARMIGGCCGTTPAHIEFLRQRLGVKRAPAAKTGDV